VVDWLLRRATCREREVLRLRFEEDLTQQEIGQRIGVSQMQVSRMLHDVLARLREVPRRSAEALAVGGQWSTATRR
jgi:RNA polymerase sigma-B factor